MDVLGRAGSVDDLGDGLRAGDGRLVCGDRTGGDRARARGLPAARVCLGRACAPAWWTTTDAHGVARWPAGPVEIAFNVLALALFLLLSRMEKSRPHFAARLRGRTSIFTS